MPDSAPTAKIGLEKFIGATRYGVRKDGFERVHGVSPHGALAVWSLSACALTACVSRRTKGLEEIVRVPRSGDVSGCSCDLEFAPMAIGPVG